MDYLTFQLFKLPLCTNTPLHQIQQKILDEHSVSQFQSCDLVLEDNQNVPVILHLVFAILKY